MHPTAEEIFGELIARRGSPPIIGGVVIHSLIGAGGMGAVFMGTHLRLHIPVAAKFMFGQEQDDAARFIDEATLAARVNHPNVVRVYDVNKEDGFLYIVQEYVEGQSAERYFQDSFAGKPVTEDFVLSLGADVARGLAAMHAESFLHLDIKPTNIMVAKRDGGCKILDLGLSRRFTPGSTLSQEQGGVIHQHLGGTPGYASPEQLQQLPVGPASDVYSLGVTMFELLAARRAHVADSWSTAVVQQSVNELPDIRPLRPDISPATAGLVARCTRINPDLRFQSALELLSCIVDATQARMAPPPAVGGAPRAAALGGALSPAAGADGSAFSRPSAPAVFCVDDDQALGAVLARILGEAGCSVQTFTDGMLALKAMQQEAPDVVILDVEMPGMTGLDICRIMRSLERLRHIPVVFLTEETAPAKMSLALHEGATDYLFKSVEPADLVARVRCLARITQAQRELEGLQQQFGQFRKRLAALVGKDSV
ncbi:MAG: protein kinase [Planctomycetota bacterium]|nr:protein kinase [Planctomycetota bacterium]